MMQGKPAYAGGAGSRERLLDHQSDRLSQSFMKPAFSAFADALDSSAPANKRGHFLE